MSLTGMVDKRTLEKYEREAREKSRESWYLSWALDTNQEGSYNNVKCDTIPCFHIFLVAFASSLQSETKAKQLKLDELTLRLKRNILPSSMLPVTKALCLI